MYANRPLAESFPNSDRRGYRIKQAQLLTKKR
ncbi:MAG: hypothetical protein ACI9LE_000938 [Paraglaciecola sp.]|jgi:hypothetical protein